MHNNYKIVYHNKFEIVDLAGGGNPRPKINRKNKYCRLLIKPNYNISELTSEIIDEEKKIIHKCHKDSINEIVYKIMKDRIEEMKSKNYKFNGEQIGNIKKIKVL